MKLYKCDFEWLYESTYSSEENPRKMQPKEARTAWLASIGVQVSDHAAEHPRGVMLNGDQIIQAMEQGFTLEVKETRDFKGPASFDFERFEQVASKLLNIAPEEQVYNSRCQVHMPGQALATYNETLLLEGSCTDNLQSHLDSGWRIIAACPQPDQRRPDYILDRFNPDRSVHTSAARD